MANFNAVTRKCMHTTNRSGHDAYRMDPKTELVSRVASCLVAEPKAYGDTTDELVELAREVAYAEPGFVARLAVYARRVLNLRAVSHLLVVTLADSHGAQGTGLVRAATRGVVRRGDDVTGVIATWGALHPNAHLAPGIRKGLRDAMESFGPEDATRYLGRDRELKMRDALRICHPHVEDPALRATFDAVVAGTARRPETWETELSERGLPAFSGTCWNISEEKCFRDMGWDKSEKELKNAYELKNSSLMLLVHPTIDEGDMSEACSIIDEVLCAARR